MQELLRELVSIPGTCGFEHEVARYLYNRLKDQADSIHVDGLGNVIVRRDGGHPGPTLMLSAHADEVGFIVKKKVNGVYKWRAVVLTKVMFAVPSDSATTQGETIEWQVPELSATIMRDDSATHVWKREATFTTEAQAEAYIKDRLNITGGVGG